MLIIENPQGHIYIYTPQTTSVSWVARPEPYHGNTIIVCIYMEIPSLSRVVGQTPIVVIGSVGKGCVRACQLALFFGVSVR